MAINLNNRNHQLEQTRGAQQKATVQNSTNSQVQNSTNAQPAQSQVSQGDSVNITPQAKSLTAMEHDLAQGTPVNESKVASLKKAISDGSYQVDANTLAKNMANFESQLV
ncbi:MAG: negative regulator of flagellin synthesis FlgM [Moritella sp.]|jgi:negative regulator of flagellin synthesis FlgM